MDKKVKLSSDVKEITEAGKIARFYGFKPIVSPALIKQDFESTKNFDKTSFPAEKAALLRIYYEEKMMVGPQPCMLYCERPFLGIKDPSHHKKPMTLESSVVTMGSYKSVCECLSIQTGLCILNSAGHKDLMVEINSIGDKESMSDFQKQISAFVRKNYNFFPADLRQAVKKDQFALLREKKKEWEVWFAECPKSIDFLSEPSRTHFKEVLEFLEIMNIPYQINSHLIGDPDISSETIFTITEINDLKNFDDDTRKELASGFRFNRMAKKLNYKKDLPCTILNISAKLKKNQKKTKIKETKHQFYLVQFGAEAKLRSFLILKELFKIGATVMHSIAKDKLSTQIGVAENSNIPYILLIGQKEALENSVLIRSTVTRAQELVPITELALRVKELD